MLNLVLLHMNSHVCVSWARLIPRTSTTSPCIGEWEGQGDETRSLQHTAIIYIYTIQFKIYIYIYLHFYIYIYNIYLFVCLSIYLFRYIYKYTIYILYIYIYISCVADRIHCITQLKHRSDGNRPVGTITYHWPSCPWRHGAWVPLIFTISSTGFQFSPWFNFTGFIYGRKRLLAIIFPCKSSFL